MALVIFYQLGQSSVEETARALLGKSRAAGWRVMLRGTSQTSLDYLDEELWKGSPECFLPHGLAQNDHATLQPIMLGTGIAPENMQALMLVDGAAFEASEARQMARVMILFDGQNKTILNIARGHWKEALALGVKAQYWSESLGRWELKLTRESV